MKETPSAQVSTNLTVESLFPNEIESDRLRHEKVDEACTIYELYNFIKDRSEIQQSLEHIFGWEKQRTLKDTREKVRKWRERWEKGTTATYVLKNKSDELVGLSWIILDWDSQKASLAIWVHPDQQHNGYSTERAHAHIEVCFEVLDLDLVEMRISTDNKKSEECVKNYLENYETDIEPDGTIQNDSYNQEHELYDSNVYSLTQEEYIKTYPRRF